MWFRLLLVAHFLAVLTLPAPAQMLGNLNDYPNLHISISYQSPDGAASQQMQLQWNVDDKGVLKVTGTARPPKKSSINTDMPATAIPPTFANARNVTRLFRFKPNKDRGDTLDNEVFFFSVSHTGLSNSVSLRIRRDDKEAWAAMMKLWKDLRAALPSPSREMLNENF